MYTDPLLSKLYQNLGNETERIDKLSSLLGYESGLFKEILTSLLTEEFLDRITPDSITIDEWNKRSDHNKLLQKYILEQSGLKMNANFVVEFWDRIKNLGSGYLRDNVSFHRKLQLLSTVVLECKVCKASPPDVVLHVDHIYAASKGGSSELWNLQLLCSNHNLIKSNHLSWRIKI